VTVAMALVWGTCGSWTTKFGGREGGGCVGSELGEGRGVAMTKVLGVQLNGT
jgi:hypothetical protein